MANEKLKEILKENYKHGFSTDIEYADFPKGLDESIVTAISKIKNEPSWLLEWRLESFKKWKEMKSPDWAFLGIEEINYQDIQYYSAPKEKPELSSLDEVDPKILETYKKLGISINEQKRLENVAVDAVFDSVSVATTYKKELSEKGIIFCSISEAVKDYPELVKKYMGSVVPNRDNYFAALNSAVFSDGSFVYIPKNVKCPMELSTYFRINAMGSGQFERTLIIADEGAEVSYNEGCTAPQRDDNQLHAAVVEIFAHKNAKVKYSTIQNWYPGDENGKGGIYNFVTKRALCHGDNSKVSWTQVETGSAVTWKYPSCILKGDNSVGEFYSVAMTKNKQQADTGTKMIHIGNNTVSKIISKGISSGDSKNTYRGLVRGLGDPNKSRNFTQCDSLFLNDYCGAYTTPYIETNSDSFTVEHEASVSSISEQQMNYLLNKGIEEEKARSLIVNGFCEEVLKNLPMEFTVEARALLALNLEGTVG